MIAVSTLKERLGISAADTSKDAMLEEIEAGVHSLFERETHRSFRSLTFISEILTGPGTPKLYIAERPRDDASGSPVIDAIDTMVVQLRAYPGDTGEETLVHDATDGFVIRNASWESAYLHRRGGYVWPLNYEIEVGYWHGYEWNHAFTNDLAAPDDVRLAVTRLAVAEYKARAVGGTGPLQSESIDNYSYTMADASSDDLRLLIDAAVRTIHNWRRRWI